MSITFTVASAFLYLVKFPVGHLAYFAIGGLSFSWMLSIIACWIVGGYRTDSPNTFQDIVTYGAFLLGMISTGYVGFLLFLK